MTIHSRVRKTIWHLKGIRNKRVIQKVVWILPMFSILLFFCRAQFKECPEATACHARGLAGAELGWSEWWLWLCRLQRQERVWSEGRTMELGSQRLATARMRQAGGFWVSCLREEVPSWWQFQSAHSQWKDYANLLSRKLKVKTK